MSNAFGGTMTYMILLYTVLPATSTRLVITDHELDDKFARLVFTVDHHLEGLIGIF